MLLALRNERETLAIVAAILRGEAPPPVIDGKAIGYHQAKFCDLGEDYSGFDCGTAACVGGHAWLIENPGDASGAERHVNSYDPESGYVDRSNGMARLYWGTFHATPKQAAQAIENYLRDGQPRWSDAKAAHPYIPTEHDPAQEAHND